MIPARTAAALSSCRSASENRLPRAIRPRSRTCLNSDSRVKRWVLRNFNERCDITIVALAKRVKGRASTAVQQKSSAGAAPAEDFLGLSLPASYGEGEELVVLVVVSLLVSL